MVNPNNGIREIINAENSFTTPVSNGPGRRPLFISTTGTWCGRLHVQWKLPGDNDFEDIDELTHVENLEAVASNLPMNSEIRVGFPAGEYDSGSVTVLVTI